ncbi:MAG: NAD(P)/FAD-dependent oxidoreductase [Candidatus Hydrogenedentes bacterium]|nr:NAD(P)/FAD-dependent oxidoreductase [Candidatus Hydrogenedentota bacterium]
MILSTTNYDAIILGAGAAGLLCAIKAGERGRRVLLIEHNDKVGKKISISGGGRCNFTNLQAEPARYLSNNPRFCYSALARYTPEDFIAWIESHGIAYHERTLGQLFCDIAAQDIIDALVSDCTKAGVEIQLDCSVRSVQKDDGFVVETTQGTFQAPALVVATGGLSIPKLGATDFGYQLATQFGLPIIPCTPALVPFTLEPQEHNDLMALSGISFDAVASIGKRAFEEAVLITHRGLSGPAILQISSYWEEGQKVRLNLFPDERLDQTLPQAKRDTPKMMPSAFLRARLSARFAKRLCDRHDWNCSLGELSDKKVRAMAELLNRWDISVSGTEGYAKAEVTRGGVDTKALSPKTMEARDVPGLYFIGEVMDVTGWLGGYNFQWAWSSAAAAGTAV